MDCNSSLHIEVIHSSLGGYAIRKCTSVSLTVQFLVNEQCHSVGRGQEDKEEGSSCPPHSHIYSINSGVSRQEAPVLLVG